MFVSKLADADGEVTDTQVWLDCARDCGYLSLETHAVLLHACEDIGKMLGGMMANPEKFFPNNLNSEK